MLNGYPSRCFDWTFVGWASAMALLQISENGITHNTVRAAITRCNGLHSRWNIYDFASMYYISKSHFPLSCRENNLRFTGPKRPKCLSINFALKFLVMWVNISFIHSEPQACDIWLSSTLEHSENSRALGSRQRLAFSLPILWQTISITFSLNQW